MPNLAHFAGTLKAYASTDNPLQTVLELVITPFGPNKNKQRIPKSEASNILRTCLHQPIKVNLDGNNLGGHKDSIPVGTIIHAELTEDAILGKGIIWNEEYPEVTEYLKKRTSENNPPGTSWEILFERSAIAEDGIEDLFNTFYAANTIVQNPSYEGKTLIRCVAEDLGLEKTESELMEELREQLAELQSQLFAMCEVIDTRYYQTYKIEEAEQTKSENVETLVERFNTLMNAVENRANDAGVALAEATTTVESLQTRLTAISAELDVLKAEKAQAELNAKIAKRESALAEVGIALTDDNKSALLEMSDTAFDIFVSSLNQVRTSMAGNKSTAEIKINLPDPVGNTEITTEDIVQSHKELTKKGK